MPIAPVLRPSILLLVLGLLACESSSPAPRTYVIRKEDSQVEFSIKKWLVFNEEGRFKDFSGSIVYDAENPRNLAVEVTVKTASVDSRVEPRDNALRSSDYFHTARYPEMTFRSTSVESNARGEYAVTGDFTMRGITRRITVPAKLVGLHDIGGELGELIAFEIAFTINRLDFQVGTPSNWLGNEVAIHLLFGASHNGRTASR